MAPGAPALDRLAAPNGHQGVTRLSSTTTVPTMASCSYIQRASNPAMTAPIIGATQNSQSWPIYSPPAKSAGPVLRAGLTDVLVTGIDTRWIKVRARPIGMPANPAAAPFDVVPTITKRKKKVITISVIKQLPRLYLPGLRSPKPLAAKRPGIQPDWPDAISHNIRAAMIAPITWAMK